MLLAHQPDLLLNPHLLPFLGGMADPDPLEARTDFLAGLADDLVGVVFALLPARGVGGIGQGDGGDEEAGSGGDYDLYGFLPRPRLYAAARSRKLRSNHQR